ncbi:MAG: HlyD family efflux transporter periplasmic adaptor subunit [Acidobacteria bacterium]|nr:HlyD family efflux transporter periplasmic adaptor subunit [Acidobacteriota bacterium]
MTRRRMIVLAAAVASAAITLVVVVRWRQAPEIPTFTVTESPFRRHVTAEGELRALKSTPVTTPVRIRRPVRVATLLPNGSRVKKDDILVTFDPTDFENEMRDGQSASGTARNNLERQDMLSAATSKNLTLDANQAQREYDAAQQFASKDVEIFSRFVVIESQIDQDLALQRRDNAENNKTTRGQQAAADRQIAEIERRVAEIKIDGAREGLDSLVIRAPHDGVFVLKPNPWDGDFVKVGKTVWRGMPIGELPDLATMEAEIFVLEADAGGLKSGVPVSLVVESDGGRKHEGKIKSVEPLARPRTRGVPVQFFSAIVEIAKTDPAVMKPGARIRATLILEKRDKAIAIPRNALFERKGKRVVFRRNGGSFVPVEVTLGSASPGKVIVEKGLKPGDVIALADPEAEKEARQ